MKKILLAASLVSVLFASCDKKQNVIPVIPEQPAPEDSTYIINGLTDMSISSLDSTVVGLNITFLQGKQDKITLSIEGLPDRVKGSFDPGAGIPGFNTTLMLKSVVAKPGVYPVTIKGVSENGLTKSYKVNLRIKDDFVCDSFFMNNIGSFTTRNVANNDSVFAFTHVNFQISNKSLTFYFNNMYLDSMNGSNIISGGMGFDLQHEVTFAVNCGNNTVTIPEKTIDAITFMGVQQYKVSGTGSINYDNQTISVTYTVTNSQNITTSYKMVAKVFLW